MRVHTRIEFSVIGDHDFAHSDKCVMIPQYYFNLHFHDDLGCGASLNMLICHLHPFSCKASVEDLWHILKSGCLFSYCFKSSLYVLAVLYQMCLLQIIFPSL